MPEGMSAPGGFTMPQSSEAPAATDAPTATEAPAATEVPAQSEAPAQEKTGGSRSFDKAERSQSSRFSGSFGTASTAANTQEQTILLAVCMGVLLAAIIVTVIFKRNV